MNKKRLLPGRAVAREASVILNKARRFIVLAELDNESGVAELKLYSFGYLAEALVARELMTVSVGIMKKHKAGAEKLMRLTQKITQDGVEVEPNKELILPPAIAAPQPFSSAHEPQ